MGGKRRFPVKTALSFFNINPSGQAGLKALFIST
jgi:hypothetical protein